MPVRYDEQTGRPSAVRLTVEDMRGRRPLSNEQPASVFNLQFRDAAGFEVTLILTSAAQVVELRNLLTP
jgi:hypothetical protein